MSMCRVFSFIFGRGYLLWPVHSLGKTLLALALLHFVLQGQTCLLLQVSLDFLLLHSSSYDEMDIFFFLVLILEGLIGHHRTIQLQLLKHYRLGHRLGLLWHWTVCFGKEKRSVCQVPYFGFFLWLRGLFHFFSGVLPSLVDITVIWIKFTHSSPF